MSQLESQLLGRFHAAYNDTPIAGFEPHKVRVLLITWIPLSIIHIFFYLAQNADAGTLLQVFVLNTNMPADLITRYSVIAYSLIALVILAVD